MSKTLYKATFIALTKEDEEKGDWIPDPYTPKVQVSKDGVSLTAEEITKLLKDLAEQNRIWQKLSIRKQVRLVE